MGRKRGTNERGMSWWVGGKRVCVGVEAEAGHSVYEYVNWNIENINKQILYKKVYQQIDAFF